MRAAGLLVVLIAALAVAGPAGATDGASAEDQRWNALREMLFADRPIHDGSALLELEAPYRAHDAAVVPIGIRSTFAQSAARHVRTITLLIDQNPAPIAGRFHFSPASGIAAIDTRVRVNAYTNVRAIAELSDGELYMTSRFVKASGGCSAPAGKDQDAALARLGKMKLRPGGTLELGQANRAQLLISHPNNTGMQMDQLTRHYVPAHFVRRIEVRYGDEPVLTVESDISLSEDPSIHFHFLPRSEEAMTVTVTDSEEQVFNGRWVMAAGDS